MGPEEYKALLVSLGIDVTPPSAESLGLPRITHLHLRTFLKHLQSDSTAGRLRRRILPHCDVLNLASFTIVASFPVVEQSLISGREERGKRVQEVLKMVRRKARESDDPLVRRSLPDILKRARLAYDTRWMGFSNSFGYVAIDRYVKYRTGLCLRPREWASLLNAAFAATGRSRLVDGNLISKNVRRFRASAHPTGATAAELIERRRPTPSS